MRVERERKSTKNERGLNDSFVIEDYDGLGSYLIISPEKFDISLDGFVDVTYQLRNDRCAEHIAVHISYDSILHASGKINVADICEGIFSNKDNICNIIQAYPGSYIPIKFDADPYQYGFNSGYMKKEDY